MASNKNISEILDKWSKLKETDLREVKKVMEWVERELGGEFTKPKRGSHYKFHHPVFMSKDVLFKYSLEHDVVNGYFSIPTVNGKRVKKCYLLRIKKIIEILGSEDE